VQGWKNEPGSERVVPTWGAHAPRVLVSTPRRNNLCLIGKKFATAKHGLGSTRDAALPLSAPQFSAYFECILMSAKILLPILALVLAAARAHAEASPAEQKVLEAIKSPDLSVVHLWAPWCSNCQAELKSGGWLKMVKNNPHVKFYFVSIWNSGEDGRAMLKKSEIADQSNVTILADPGPRTGNKIKQFAGLPLSWIPTTWVYRGGDLRYALNYGEVRFPVLQQFIEDSKSEWSHKGEPTE
jgi:thiol-disulfide isomerase/thioredoxin